MQALPTETKWPSAMKVEQRTVKPKGAYANFPFVDRASSVLHQTERCNGSTSWAAGPRWHRILVAGLPPGDQTSMLVWALVVAGGIGVFVLSRFPRCTVCNASVSMTSGLLKGEVAKIRRRLAADRRHRQRRRKKRLKPKGMYRIVAMEALWLGGRRVPGRRVRSWQGCTCGPRAGVECLFVEYTDMNRPLRLGRGRP